MSEYRRQDRSSTVEMEKIDLMKFLPDIYQGVKKFWWLVIGLAVLFAVQSYFSVSSSYQPVYVARATMSVQSAGNLGEYGDNQTAQQMEKVFPYILTSGVLEEVIKEDLGVDYLPGTIKAQAEPGTNLFTVSTTSGDAQMAYDMLQSVLKNYPVVAEFVIGQTKLEILDESGVPTDTKRASVIRGSYKKGAMKGALIGLVIMAIYILTRRTVKYRKDLKRIVNLEDFGSLPYIHEKKRKKNKKYLSSISLMNERVPQGYLEASRKFCIKVVKEMEQKAYRTILITSSIPGEGKTTVATNLAIAAAKRGQKVILVDCDPRNPSVARAFQDDASHAGLSKILSGEAKLEEELVTIPMTDGSLRVIFGGSPDNRASRLLGTEAMKQVIESLKEMADLVILDTAPCEMLADASALAKYVDAACYVVREDHAKMREIRNGVQSLSMSGVDILGYVFNADSSARSRAYGYGYSYGYRRYGGYGSYGNYGNYGSYGNYGRTFRGKLEEENTTDKYGRVRKE